MHIKTNLRKHRYSPFLSWAWLLAGALAFMCIHHVHFAPIFAERFQGDAMPVRPLYWGAIACYLAVGWSMFSGRKLPYSNNFEVLSLTSFLAICTLLLFLAATREFYSGTYLLVLFCFQLAWLGIEVWFRNRFVAYRFAVFPSSIPLSAGDFLEHDIVFLGARDEPAEAAWMDGVDAVVVDFTVNLSPTSRALLSRCQRAGIPILPMNLFLENVWGRIPVELFNDMAIGNISFRPYLLVKPVLNWCAAFAGLLVVTPVVLVAAGVVKLTSSGPAFFCQERVGMKGKSFTIYKLRTMHEGDSAGINVGEKVTAIGGILRRYHIDELPQLVNVLKGDMALVGPRPETVELSDLYEKEIPGYILRNQVRPGVTSWALIHQGNVSGVENTRIKLSYDLFYIKHASCFLDAYIVLKTIWIIVFGIETLTSPAGPRIFGRAVK